MESSLVSWLVEQLPVVVILGVIAYVLYKDNKELREQVSQLQNHRITELREVLNESFAGTNALEKLSTTVEKLADHIKTGDR